MFRNIDIIKAVYNKDGTTLKALIEKGADVNAIDHDGNTALIIAARYGYLDLLSVLLAHNATVDHEDKEGNTALTIAAIANRRVIMDILIKKGAKVDHGNHRGMTPLLSASYLCNRDAVEVLLENGADVDLTNKVGSSPLIEATYFNRHGVIDVLLSHNANVNLEDQGGTTALKLAIQRNDVHLVSVLLQKGALIYNFSQLYAFLERCNKSSNKDPNKLHELSDRLIALTKLSEQLKNKKSKDDAPFYFEATMQEELIALKTQYDQYTKTVFAGMNANENIFVPFDISNISLEYLGLFNPHKKNLKRVEEKKETSVERSKISSMV